MKNAKGRDTKKIKFSSFTVDHDFQAIMKVLNENFDYEEEKEPKCSLFKNLWLEAEAEVCSINYKARYNRMKIEMEKSELNKANG